MCGCVLYLHHMASYYHVNVCLFVYVCLAFESYGKSRLCVCVCLVYVPCTWILWQVTPHAWKWLVCMCVCVCMCLIFAPYDTPLFVRERISEICEKSLCIICGAWKACRHHVAPDKASCICSNNHPLRKESVLAWLLCLCTCTHTHTHTHREDLLAWHRTRQGIMYLQQQPHTGKGVCLLCLCCCMHACMCLCVCIVCIVCIHVSTGLYVYTHTH